MGSLFGKSRVNVCSRCGLLAVLLVLSFPFQEDDVLGQSQGIQYPLGTGQNNGRPPAGQEPEINESPMYRQAQREAAKKRNLQRQNKLVADSSRIVELANQLSLGVSPQENPSTPAALSKRAEEIEKLARNVKELMKSE